MTTPSSELDVLASVHDDALSDGTHSGLQVWLEGDLVSAAALRRLACISFLGLLDLQPDADQSSSRLDHSLAVAQLGCETAKALNLSRLDGALLVAACLLHDVGHYPLSHSAEAAFRTLTGSDHHGRARAILIGDQSAAGIPPLGGALRALGLDPASVWQVIAGGGERADGLDRLLTAPINLDTLDGIRRTARAFGRSAPDLEQPFCLVEGRLALRPDAIHACDAFWELKDTVYKQIIERPSNILAEQALSERLLQIDSSQLPPFSDLDDEWLHQLLGVTAPPGGTEFEIVEDDRADAIARRTLKRYWVDSSVEPGPLGLPVKLWIHRYRHERRPGYLVPRRHGPSSAQVP